MSQNTQQYPHMGTDLQSSSIVDNDDPLAQVDTLKIVTCSVCRAIYVPTNKQYTQGSAALLETAFLDICHFCFRCQRPACPQCWHPVHHTCASCSEAAQLPFRAPVPSLEGLVFLPTTSAQANKVSFICQRNGRFYTPEPTLSQPEAQGSSVPSVSSTNGPVTSGTLPVIQSKHAAMIPALSETVLYPTWLQEVLGKKADEQSMQHLATGVNPAVNLTNIYQSAKPTNVWSHANQMNWIPIAQTAPQPLVPLVLPALATQPMPLAAPAPETEIQDEREQQNDMANEDISLLERIENILIVITSILLLAVVLMMVLSICSPQANTFFLKFLHIDIRTEIAYLLQLR